MEAFGQESPAFRHFKVIEVCGDIPVRSEKILRCLNAHTIDLKVIGQPMNANLCPCNAFMAVQRTHHVAAPFKAQIVLGSIEWIVEFGREVSIDELAI